MAMLDTNTINHETGQTAFWPFFNAPEVRIDPIKGAVLEAREPISSHILLLIDKCEALKGKTCESPEEAKDVSMQLYDAQAAIRRCAEQAVLHLESRLPKGPHKLGNTLYFVIEDVHARTRQNNWLLMLDDDANVSFMEPRGLYGDDEFKPAGFEHHVRLIEDIITASQPSL